MHRRRVIIMKGLPGSGKSTWAIEYCLRDSNYIRVSRDDLRHMRGKYWLPKQEEMISDMEIKLMEIALSHGKNVIIDATNLNPKYVQRLIENIEAHENVDVDFQDFTFVPVEECIKRDLNRANSVGAEVIQAMYDKYLRPKYILKPVETTRSAVICDLDGTLCIHNGRSPYDEEKCDTDLVNETVRNILWQTTGLHSHLIFVSGRQDKVREKTEAWIKTNVPGRTFDLFMRKTGDNRNDAIVKRELFFEHIDGKFKVDFVLDDRNRVVEMWRKDLGLTCLQVAEGNF